MEYCHAKQTASHQTMKTYSTPIIYIGTLNESIPSGIPTAAYLNLTRKEGLDAIKFKDLQSWKIKA